MLFNVHTRIFCCAGLRKCCFCRAGFAQRLFCRVGGQMRCFVARDSRKACFVARDLRVSPVKKANGQSGELYEIKFKII